MLKTPYTSMSLKLFCKKQQVTIQLYYSLFPCGFPSSFPSFSIFAGSYMQLDFPGRLNLCITDTLKLILKNEHAPGKVITTPSTA